MTYVLANKLGRTGAANFVHLLVSNKLFLDLLSVCSNLVSYYILLDLSCFLRNLQGVVFN